MSKNKHSVIVLESRSVLTKVDGPPVLTGCAYVRPINQLFKCRIHCSTNYIFGSVMCGIIYGFDKTRTFICDGFAFQGYFVIIVKTFLKTE